MHRHLAVWMKRLGSLSLRDWWLLLRITGILLILPPLLRWLPLPRTMRILDPGLGSAPGRSASPARIIELTQGLLGRNPVFHDSCLKRSLVLFRLLRQIGQPVIIRFGVTMEGEDIAGHSWLEQSGRLIAEHGDPYQSYSVIYSYPSATGQK